MSNLLRLIVIVGLIACAIAVVALGFARNDADLLAPLHFALFVLAALLYLLPTGLAMYRDCKATLWIVLLNILLGWTIFGWFISLGWAAAGKMRPPVPSSDRRPPIRFPAIDGSAAAPPWRPARSTPRVSRQAVTLKA